jgi:hypothetical protein
MYLTTRLHTYIQNGMTRGSISLYTGKWVFHIAHSNTFPPTFPQLEEIKQRRKSMQEKKARGRKGPEKRLRRNGTTEKGAL